MDDVVSTSILADGWLLEDGTVDYDKIGTKCWLIISRLHGRLKQSEWDYKYKMLSDGGYCSNITIRQTLRNIYTDDLTVDEDVTLSV